MTTPESTPSDAHLLMWALFKLQGMNPLLIDGAEAQACHRAFAAGGGPALFSHGTGSSVEIRVTSQAEAAVLRQFYGQQSEGA
jgi:hypothetical protein